MKNINKRALALVLVVLTALSLLPISALADYANGSGSVAGNDSSVVIRVALDKTSCGKGETLTATVSLRNVNGTTTGLTGGFVSESFIVTMTDGSYDPVSWFPVQTAAGLDTVCRFTFPANCTLADGTYKITARKQVGNNIFFGEASFAYTAGQSGQTEQPEQPQQPEQPAQTEPFIITQPKNRTVVVGSTVKFTVQAEGESLQYRWYVQKKDETAWTRISGANKPELSFTAGKSMNGSHYRCEVSGGSAKTTSETARLTVVSAPRVASEPVSVCVRDGKTVTFKVKATGGSLKYQWYYQKPGTDRWVPITNATGASLSFVAKLKKDGYKYRCLVENKAGSVYSKAAKLTVR